MFESLDGNPLTAFAGMFQDPRSRWFVVYVATSVLLAYVLYRVQARRDPELASGTSAAVKGGLAMLVNAPLVSGHPLAAAAATTVLYILAFDFALWLAH